MKTPALYDGREVYLPLESLRTLGASYKLTHRDETAIVSFENTAVEFALARPGKQPMLPLSAVAGFLKVEFVVQKGVCEVRARGSHVDSDSESKGDNAESDDAPDRDTNRDTRPSKPNTARKTDSQTNAPPAGKSSSGNPSLKQPSAHNGAVQSAQYPQQDAQRPASPDNDGGTQGDTGQKTKATPPTAPPSQAVSKPASAPLRINAIAFEAADDSHATIKVRTSGKVTATAKVVSDPARLVVDIPSCAFPDQTADWPIEHPFLSAMHAGYGDVPTTTRIVIDLSRPVSYRIVDSGPEGFTIALGLPKSAGRRLENMVIVVDPGHGGAATGCHCVVNGQVIYEKQITLAIAMKLRALLAEAGVNVIMTRTRDFDPGLTARPRIANDNNADLFVSIHVDDCPGSSTASGTTAYYHMNDQTSRALAQSIISHVVQVSGLPSRGAKSDHVRFQNGMAVLRWAAMPATLVEVAYISTAKDRRKLLDDEWRQTIAQAIFDGIKSYVENGSSEASRVSLGEK